MTIDKTQNSKLYAPVELSYLVAPPDHVGGEMFSGKADSISDQLSMLYQQLDQRKQVNQRIMNEVYEDIQYNSSKLYSYKFNLFATDKHKTNLERKVDLLEKTKRSELVDYWKDCFKINMYIFTASEEYKKARNRMKLLE
jgi:hypothetical protein